MQAEIQAVHDRAATASDTDWRTILRLYAELPFTPVVALNRAIALGMAAGPDAGLAELDRVADAGLLAGHNLLPAARADLLRRAGRRAEAADAYRAALQLAPTRPERDYLTRRLSEVS